MHHTAAFWSHRREESDDAGRNHHPNVEREPSRQRISDEPVSGAGLGSVQLHQHLAMTATVISKPRVSEDVDRG